ncbi:MAG: tetratricopeptide repeat protein [Longimicrobiales bacterium]
MTELQTDVEHLLDHADWMNTEGQPIEAITVLGEVLDRLASDPPSELQARALRGVGLAFRTLGDVSESALAFEEALDVARACGNALEQAEALNGLAIARQLEGELALAETHYTAAAGLALDEGLFQLTGIIEQNLGVIASDLGQTEKARVRYETALGAFEEAGDLTGVCWTLNNLGLLYAQSSQLIQALDFFDQARAVADQGGDRELSVRVEINRADALLQVEEWERARATLETAISVARTTTSPLLVAEGLRYLAKAERQAGRPWNALGQIRQAAETAHAAPDLLLLAEVKREAGLCWLALGDETRAKEAWTDAQNRFEEVGALRDRAELAAMLEEIG